MTKQSIADKRASASAQEDCCFPDDRNSGVKTSFMEFRCHSATSGHHVPQNRDWDDQKRSQTCWTGASDSVKGEKYNLNCICWDTGSQCRMMQSTGVICSFLPQTVNTGAAMGLLSTSGIVINRPTDLLLTGLHHYSSGTVAFAFSHGTAAVAHWTLGRSSSAAVSPGSSIFLLHMYMGVNEPRLLTAFLSG